MISNVKTGNGRTYKARAIAFYFRDETGFERYVGRVAVIEGIDGLYLYIPQTNGQTVRKNLDEIHVVSK